MKHLRTFSTNEFMSESLFIAMKTDKRLCSSSERQFQLYDAFQVTARGHHNLQQRQRSAVKAVFVVSTQYQLARMCTRHELRRWYQRFAVQKWCSRPKPTQAIKSDCEQNTLTNFRSNCVMAQELSDKHCATFNLIPATAVQSASDLFWRKACHSVCLI